jgi:DNA repair protein RadD
MLTPRDYQAEAADEAVSFMRSSKDPGVLSLCTAAGKSIIVAVVAAVVTKAGKRVLCLAPNGDLIKQNSSKYRATGNHCSIFSAKLGQKKTGHNVVFGTPRSVANSLDRFDESYALVIIDECDGVSEDEETTYQLIIRHIRAQNPNVRILGLTATPFRGRNKLVGEDNTFKHIIYDLPHGELSKRGWVVPYRMGAVHEHYELCTVNTSDQAAIDSATLNKERLTRAIVADVQNIMAVEGRNCGLFFASSIEHGKEILSYLPVGQAVFIDGTTANRGALLDEIRAGKWRYVVNFNVLSVGTDLPIVDVIILLRAMGSARLLLQILGRGCRLYDPLWSGPASELNWLHPDYQGKTDALVLDYGQNIERFSLDDDLTISGLVAAKLANDAGDEPFYIDCPDCSTPNPHTAVRCVGQTHKGRCDYYFVFKTCDCGVINAPSARYCRSCKAELVDVEKKLTRKPAIGAGVAVYVDVIGMRLRPHTKGNNRTLRVDYEVMYGDRAMEVMEFLNPEPQSWGSANRFASFCEVTGAIGTSIDRIVESAPVLTMPSRLLVKRDRGSKYFSVVSRSKE